jgi:predicted GNAT family acetyltransferase
MSAASIVRSERNAMTLTDKTGAPVTVSRKPHEFSIDVEGKTVGRAEFTESDGQRVFYHTEVDDDFGGRGLGTAVISEALAATRADGLRIVAVCPMVSAYVKKHHDFDDLVDPPTPEILQQHPQ